MQRERGVSWSPRLESRSLYALKAAVSFSSLLTDNVRALIMCNVIPPTDSLKQTATKLFPPAGQDGTDLQNPCTLGCVGVVCVCVCVCAYIGMCAYLCYTVCVLEVG